jgi:ubiquinone/menaquinone biosynthesis C-methylase UbiE
MKTRLSHDERRQKEYYNQIASVYDSYFANTYALQYQHRIYDSILDTVDLEGKHVLDAMCGGGEASTYLANRSCSVSALDISDEQCRIYSERFPRNAVVCESILNTNFPDDTFDLVVIGSLHHTQPKVAQAISEIVRILKPNGYLLAWEPSTKSIIDKFRMLWYKLDQSYFQSNEKSIDINQLLIDANGKLKAIKVIFGGGLAYLLVHQAMAFRIPHWALSIYAPWLIKIEFGLDFLKIRKSLHMWVLALLQNSTSVEH